MVQCVKDAVKRSMIDSRKQGREAPSSTHPDKIIDWPIFHLHVRQQLDVSSHPPELLMRIQIDGDHPDKKQDLAAMTRELGRDRFQLVSGG